MIPLNQLLHSPSLVDPAWISRRQWSCALIERPFYPSLAWAERLSNAIYKHGYVECGYLSLQVDDWEAQDVSRFQCSAMDLIEVARRESAYLVTNERVDFVFHVTDQDFMLIAGELSFVEDVLKCSLAAACHDWNMFATHPGWTTSEGEAYAEISNWYKIAAIS